MMQMKIIKNDYYFDPGFVINFLKINDLLSGRLDYPIFST